MNLLNRWLSFLTFIWIRGIEAVDDEYNVLHNDGSFEFGYNNPDSYHFADGNRNNVVKGEFGGRNPKTGAIDSTVYTAGPRGFRPRGRNVHRKYDLNQNGPLPIGSKDDPYFDPYEDPSYNFSFRTRTYNRDENANRAGDVSGRYSYLDDVGERHNVEFIAGKNTGFHVRTPFPDSNPRAYGPLYFNGRGKPIPRGRTSIQRGLDGSYRFVSAGPDQRRTEVSDATGHVRGSYTYLDDKGVQHSVHYIAGPETGYRVLKNVKGPHLPTVFGPGIIPSDFYDLVGKDKDVFDTAASGHVNPINNNVDNNLKPDKPDLPGFDAGIDVNKDDFNQFTNELGSTTPSSLGRPTNRPFGRPSRPGGAFNKPSYEDDSDDSDFDLFGDGGGSSTSRPSFDDGSYKTTTRPPITVSTAPSRPFDVPSSSGSSGFGDSSEDYGSRPRPSVTTTYPTTTITTTTTDDDFDAGPSLFGDDDFIAGRPGPGRPGERPFGGSGARPGGGGSGSFRPTRPGSAFGPRPGGGAFGSRPGGAFGSRPRPGGRPTVRPPKPSYDDFDSDTGVDGDDFGLFGSESNSRPPYPNKPVHFGITDAGSAGQDSKCPNCKGTIVTNLGDRTFTVPPGVSVRAHVQAIDLIPFSERVPSPSEQLRADTSLEREQLNEAQASSDVVSTISTPGNTTVNVSTTTLATTTKKSTTFTRQATSLKRAK